MLGRHEPKHREGGPRQMASQEFGREYFVAVDACLEDGTVLSGSHPPRARLVGYIDAPIPLRVLEPLLD